MACVFSEKGWPGIRRSVGEREGKAWEEHGPLHSRLFHLGSLWKNSVYCGAHSWWGGGGGRETEGGRQPCSPFSSDETSKSGRGGGMVR